mmetsp:Transcript_20410/g.35164  ORF Transcript_20410/g.35164 Transcript_20410/m.35164 type:complete len:225 (-) Transcript_20410:445-1119(-)
MPKSSTLEAGAAFRSATASPPPPPPAPLSSSCSLQCTAYPSPFTFRPSGLGFFLTEQARLKLWNFSSRGQNVTWRGTRPLGGTVPVMGCTSSTGRRWWAPPPGAAAAAGPRPSAIRSNAKVKGRCSRLTRCTVSVATCPSSSALKSSREASRKMSGSCTRPVKRNSSSTPWEGTRKRKNASATPTASGVYSKTISPRRPGSRWPLGVAQRQAGAGSPWASQTKS